MITVSDAVEKIVTRSRYLSEAMSKNLVNISSLARYVKPELEEMVFKDVSDAAIIMALTRFQKTLKPVPQYKHIFKRPPEIISHSSISMCIFSTDKKSDVLKIASEKTFRDFVRITKSTTQLSVIAPESKLGEMHLPNHTHKRCYQNLSAITIRLPSAALDTPGAFYFFLKSLAWDNINVIEIITLREEFTILVEEKDTTRTLEVIQSLFTQKEIF
jgi:hypothetical protein